MPVVSGADGMVATAGARGLDACEGRDIIAGVRPEDIADADGAGNTAKQIELRDCPVARSNRRAPAPVS